MRFKTWPVAAIGLISLLVLIAGSMLTASRRAEVIYVQLDQLNTRRHDVDTKLRRLRSDVNLSGIFVRDYLLDVAREGADVGEELRRALVVDDVPRARHPTHCRLEPGDPAEVGGQADAAPGVAPDVERRPAGGQD
jgi:hypothetical protein